MLPPVSVDAGRLISYIHAMFRIRPWLVETPSSPAADARNDPDDFEARLRVLEAEVKRLARRSAVRPPVPLDAALRSYQRSMQADLEKRRTID
jgi:exonuclease VII small subunit